MALVTGLATANPPRYASQREVYEFFAGHFELSAGERELYRRLLLDGPIKGRHFALARDEQACEQSPDRAAERFSRFAVALASQAARAALAAAGRAPADVTAVVANTCTGYLCPGLSSYLVESLGLGPSVRTFDLAGMGCGAAIPNLQCACGLLALDGQARDDRRAGPAAPARVALSVAVEICSATLFMGPHADLAVSNSLFADGAAAAVIEPAPDQTRAGPTSAPVGSAESAPAACPLLRLVDFESLVWPRHREELRYRSEGGRLRNVLSRRVPVVGARAVREVASRLLARHGLAREQVDFWAVHPGGSAVLDQVGRALALPGDALRFSRGVLADFGNMSSPSVLFVLKRIIEQAGPRPGQRGLLLSFGAGFTAFAALVEF